MLGLLGFRIWAGCQMGTIEMKFMLDAMSEIRMRMASRHLGEKEMEKNYYSRQ